MEIKPVVEYKEPEYPTGKECKSGILGFIMRSGKISISVAVLYLMMNNSFAMNEMVDMRGVQSFDDVFPYVRNIQTITYSIAGISAVATIVSAFICNKKLKLSDDDIEKEKIKKSRKKSIIWGASITTILLIIGWMVEVVYYSIFMG